MIWRLVLGFGAGALTTLSPCVLPVLPLVVGGATQEHRYAPLAMAAGMTTAFAVLGIAIAATGAVAGLDQDIVRRAAAALVALSGIVILSPPLQRRFAAISSPVANAAGRWSRLPLFTGLGGQALLGGLLGAVWSPCSGPTLGAAVGLAGQQGGALGAASVMLAFGFGASAPLVAIAYGARRAFVASRERLARWSGAGKLALGAMLLASGTLIFMGLDKIIEASILRILPSWWLRLTTKL